MENMFVEHGCSLSRTCMYEDQSLPSIHGIDSLVVMGGPMGVGDDDEYPWLTLEKEFIESVIKRGIPVLGVCLGAQLIANVLGAEVTKNVHEEIGWFPVKRTKGLVDERMENLPISFDALHWHSDTFDIPNGAKNFITSEACANQGFVYGDSVLALQFHLEMLPSHVQSIYQECGNPEKTATYVQGLEDMLAPTEKYQQASKILEKFLEAFIFQKVPQ
jgi:GMP synthase-like glutamine amidotransferase